MFEDVKLGDTVYIAGERRFVDKIAAPDWIRLVSHPTSEEIMEKLQSANVATTPETTP